MKPLNKYIDHTILKPFAQKEAVVKLCEEAKQTMPWQKKSFLLPWRHTMSSMGEMWHAIREAPTTCM